MNMNEAPDMTYPSTTPALNRVPRVTVDFWLIKLMAVTMGETAADYLAVNLGLGLTATSLIMAAVLIGALFCNSDKSAMCHGPIGWPSC